MAEDTAQTKQKATEIDKGSTMTSDNSKIDDNLRSKRSRRDWHEGGGQERIGSRLPNRAQSEYHPRNRKSSDSRSRNRALSQNRQPRRITNIEALIQEARKARLDKQVIFDLSKRSKFELNDWFKTTAPSKIRRSDGVGWIYVLSKSITEQDKKKLFDSVKEENTALKRDWSKISEDPNSRITFQTFEDLAEKHDFKIGKWLTRAAEPDEIWIKLVMDFAYDKFPPGTIALKVSPVNDVETPGASGPNEEHLMCVINKDMTNQKEVFAVEKAIRNVPIRFAIQYKPLIYTELGIYRGNKFCIRPTIYNSVKEVLPDGDSEFKIENIAREDWHFLPYRNRDSEPDITKVNKEADIKNTDSELEISTNANKEVDIKNNNKNNRLTDLQAMLETLRKTKIENEKEPIDVNANVITEKVEAEHPGDKVNKIEKEKEPIDVNANVITENVKTEHPGDKVNKKETKPKRTPITWP